MVYLKLESWELLAGHRYLLNVTRSHNETPTPSPCLIWLNCLPYTEVLDSLYIGTDMCWSSGYPSTLHYSNIVVVIRTRGTVQGVYTRTTGLDLRTRGLDTSRDWVKPKTGCKSATEFIIGPLQLFISQSILNIFWSTFGFYISWPILNH